MKKVIPILIIILISIGCNSNSDFNSEEWNQKGVDWWMTDVREKMIEDLIQSDTLINLKKKEVIELLGQPINLSSNRQII